MTTICQLKGLSSTFVPTATTGSTVENTASRFNITTESINALHEVIVYFSQAQRPDVTLSKLTEWNYLLNRDSLGIIFNGSLNNQLGNDFVIELRLNPLGVDVAKELLLNMYSITPLLEVVNDADLYRRPI